MTNSESHIGPTKDRSPVRRSASTSGVQTAAMISQAACSASGFSVQFVPVCR